MKSKKILKILFSAFLALSFVVSSGISAFAADTRYKQDSYELGGLGNISVPTNWVGDLYQEDGVSIYSFYDEEIAGMYGYLRFIGINKQITSSFVVDKEQLVQDYSDLLYYNFMMRYDYKAVDVVIGGKTITAFGIPKSNFSKHAGQLALFVIILTDDGFIEVTLVDDYMLLMDDVEMYEPFFTSLFKNVLKVDVSDTAILDTILKAIG